MNYKTFLELIATPDLRRSHGKKELSEYALSKLNSPVLSRCPVLLRSNPLKDSHKKDISIPEYENILSRGMRYRLEKRRLIDPQKRRRDFQLFLMKHSTTSAD